jgi:threonine synthase
VRGGYDAASRLGADAASDLDRWGWVNVTLRPWYELGARTAGWEIVEQLGWELPDRVVAPMASGALVRALHESMAHLVELGVAAGDAPKVTAVQPAGCAPVAEAFATGADRVRPVRSPHTIAESLEMGDPPDGHAVLDLARATGGAVAAVAEDGIMEAVDLLRRTEGIKVEPAGGVVVAGLADLVGAGVIDRSERVVAVLTGGPPPRWSPDPAVERRAGTDPGVVPPPGVTGTIEPSVSALTGLLPPELLR